jgi:hypothetical protein
MAKPLLAALPRADDPHYTEAGFFDLHVCNWPERPPLFLAVFTSTRFADVTSVTVFDPAARPLLSFNLQNYRDAPPAPGKPPKRIYLKDIDVPPGATDGWYKARIELKNGRRIWARDYVRLVSLPRATNLRVERAPLRLRWDAVPGARFYKVTVRDTWQNGKPVYSSRLLTAPELPIPNGVLEADGIYTWRVNSRDSNEDPKLGDFNHGSLSDEAELEP